MYHGSSAAAPADPPPFRSAFTYALRAATEAAAVAARAWLAEGDRPGAARASAEAMRRALGTLALNGTLVVGDEADVAGPVLPPGLVLGQADAADAFDIAVDPVEGTSYLAQGGLNNALSVLALAPAGSLFRPGPAFYMEKMAGPPAVVGRIDPAAPVAERLRCLAEALDKPVRDLVVYVQEKPRHRRLVEAIQATGARVALHAAGDVAGALMAAIPGSGVDAMMGTGGTPEGVITACAVKALGGSFHGRINPQLNTERMAVAAAGMDTERWMSLDDMVAAPAHSLHFCATGIADGLLLNGPAETPEGLCLQTLLVGGGLPGRQVLTSWVRNPGAGR
ncbi:Fructose-1,6-bisphosphatase, GlpX type [Caenispirillum salinarum AK4]|uniref:Fructose-1,6-bisphosphatase n=1 Tax=Caenispirillum salinarum AK4 TaxID=1238182 RepID=K9HKY9_9PROT|nr:fructose-bisphosphatase class II [Caenispirillum salinarum]EKV29231.1 Fructose-1,6-bisphosphatase, GlpX type [Caenispirillum salinarum AK4]